MVQFVQDAHTYDSEAFKAMVGLVGISFPYPPYEIGEKSATVEEITSAMEYFQANPQFPDPFTILYAIIRMVGVGLGDVQNAVKGLAGIDHDADVQNIMAAMKDFHPVQAVQAADFPAVGAPVGDVGSLEAPVQSLASSATAQGLAAGLAAPLLFALGTIALESEANPQLASASEAFRSLFSKIFLRKEAEMVMDDVSEDTY